MTMQEAKLAAVWRIPVICQGITYSRISALSIRYSSEDEIERRGYPAERPEAELEDQSRNSITVCKVKDVEAADTEAFARIIAEYNLVKEKST